MIVLGSETLSLVEMGAFLSASSSVGFGGESRVAIYRWAERLLCHQEYLTQKRRAKGLIKAYMERMTGLSRAQCTRLIAQYAQTGRLVARRSACHTFPRRYTVEDVALLARVDQAHERLSGPATRAILRREFEVYGKREFERLSGISNGQLYNLRSSPEYRKRRHVRPSRTRRLNPKPGCGSMESPENDKAVSRPSHHFHSPDADDSI